MTRLVCPHCDSVRLRKRGKNYSRGVLSQRYSCRDCHKPVYVAVDVDGNEAKRGNIPEIGLNENLQELEVTGVTYLKKDDNNVLHWVKTKAKTSSVNLLEEFTNRLLSRFEPLPAISPPAHTIDDLLTQYTITDLHVGMYSWAEETGAAWDLDVCYQLITGAVDIALERSPNSKTGLLLQLGDFFHFDGHNAVTPTHGHLLDAAGRFQHMLQVGEDIVLETIEKLLRKHDHVKIIIAQGNHDPSTSDTLRSLIRRYYSRNERVQVIGGPNPFYAFQHGKTMIGAHHGHLKKRVTLPSYFCQNFAEMWGNTEYRYLHSGHLHTYHAEERGGATTIQHSTLAAPDAYAAHRFDKTLRSINSITYSDKYGMVTQSIIPVAMVAAKNT